ncbi:hypothetical protein, partial [Salmonella enterica]
ATPFAILRFAAALLALISPSEGEANQCRTILTQMKQ